MNLPRSRLRTTWAPARRLPVSVRPGRVPTRMAESSALLVLRQRLLGEALEDVADDALRSLLRWAAGEAEAQAWHASYPLLLFPVLFEEKAHLAREYHAHQAEIARGTQLTAPLPAGLSIA